MKTTESIPPKTTLTSAEAFRHLANAMQKLNGEVHIRTAAHIRAITQNRFNNLGLYHATSEISDSEKVQTYKLLFNAFTTKGGPDYSKLLGQIGKGATEAVPEQQKSGAPDNEDKPGAAVTATHHEELDVVSVSQVQVEVKPDNAVPIRTQAGSLEEAILKLVNERAKVSGAEIDTDQIRKIAKAVFAEEREKESLSTDLTKMISEAMMAAVKNTTVRFEFVNGTGELKSLDGMVHPQVTQLATWLKAGVPTWAWSRAGSGKTHSARQVAALLEVEPFVISVDPTLTVSKLLGYRNVMDGSFVEGFIYKAYKFGGLIALDEIDTGDPGVIASINALLSNEHYLFPNNETVERHKSFYCLALANSKGLGATAGYVARNRLDAATLDRFAVIEYLYDEGMEMMLACGIGSGAQRPWKAKSISNITAQQCELYVKWVQKVREFVKDSVLISPRASINGCKAIRAGVPIEEVANALIFKLCAPDTITRIQSACGTVEAL